MEIMEALQEVQSRLRKHDAALKQMLVLEHYILDVNQLAYHYAINSSYVHVLQLMLRRSAAEGMRKMYRVYRLKQWFHMQHIVRQMSQSYRWESGHSLITQMESVHIRPEYGHTDKDDVASQTWLIMEKEFYRTS